MSNDVIRNEKIMQIPRVREIDVFETYVKEIVTCPLTSYALG